jgi:hypothetical protein
MVATGANMYDLKLALDVLQQIYDEATHDDMSLSERSGLYAAARLQCDDIHQYLVKGRDGREDTLEDVQRFKSHISAALGFGATNGHNKAEHLSWALSALPRLRNVLIETGPKRA